MGMLLTADAGFSLSSILEYGTTVLTWMLTSLGSVLTFFTSNSGLMLWIVLGIAGVVFVYFKKLL